MNRSACRHALGSFSRFEQGTFLRSLIDWDGGPEMILTCCLSSVRHIAVGIALSFALLFCTADAAAQASRVGATLEGIVRDTSGAVIPNSKVTLHNPFTNPSRTVTTDD